MKMHNCSLFLNVYVTLIYVATWHNEERSTKSQKFRIYIIYRLFYFLIVFHVCFSLFSMLGLFCSLSLCV